MSKVSIKPTTSTPTCCQGQGKSITLNRMSTPKMQVKYKVEKQCHGDDHGSIRLLVLGQRKTSLLLLMAHLNRRLYSSCEWKNEQCWAGQSMDRTSSQPGCEDRRLVWLTQEIWGRKTRPVPRSWELMMLTRGRTAQKKQTLKTETSGRKWGWWEAGWIITELQDKKSTAVVAALWGFVF